MDCCDVLYFFEGGGKAADAADVIFHEHHRGLWVGINNLFDGHVFRNLLFIHDFTIYCVVSRYKDLAYKDSYR